MSCRWHEKQIVVLENVVIDDPYTVERVRSQDKNALKRVKQVVCTPPPSFSLASCLSYLLTLLQLEGERRRLETARRSATPVSAEKKGG